MRVTPCVKERERKTQENQTLPERERKKRGDSSSRVYRRRAIVGVVRHSSPKQKNKRGLNGHS